MCLGIISNEPTLSTLYNSQFSLNIYIFEALEKKYQTLLFFIIETIYNYYFSHDSFL